MEYGIEESIRGWGIDEVVIMDNDKEIEDEMLQAVKKLLQLNPTIAANADEVADLTSETKRNLYLLDIKMGTFRSQEGLNALERVKSINKNSIVCIYSGYPKLYEKYASNLSADYFKEKTGDVEKDLKSILATLYERFFTETKGTRQKQIKNNTNMQEFQRLSSDSDWVEKNLGKYVAIVEGKFVAADFDKRKIINMLFDNFPLKDRFIQKITRNRAENVIDFPTPLSIE